MLATGESVVVPPEPARHDAALTPFQTDASLRRASDRAINVDVIFPVLHGTFGEDGTIQGLLELADIAYVGAGVLGSSAGMDKDIMKSLFRAAGLPIVKHVTVLRGQFEREPKKVEKLVESKLKYPVFVKPANLGSSVGISKAHDRKELGPAIAEAAKFDRKIVIEEGVGGKKNKAREMECAVLGNDDPKASVAGEIVPCKEFYDYDAKYLVEGSEGGDPREDHESGNEDRAAPRHRRLPGRRLHRPGARRFSDGPQIAQDFRQRDQHHARLHRHQHVSQTVGRDRSIVSRPDRPPDSTRHRTPRRQEAESVQPLKCEAAWWPGRGFDVQIWRAST